MGWTYIYIYSLCDMHCREVWYMTVGDGMRADMYVRVWECSLLLNDD
jgi:hypothetical protein